MTMLLATAPGANPMGPRCAGEQAWCGAGGARWLAGYRLERLLGGGGAPRVYLARDGRGRAAVLKVLACPPKSDAAAWRRFCLECELLSSLNDPRVVHVREQRVIGDTAYLALEYVAGGTLRDRLGGAAAPAAAVRFLHEAACALAAIHSAGIVHRDVKPDNLLLRADGSLVLSDFSVAARTGDTAARVPPGRLVGTACYAAPEQLEGALPAPSADVYGLGVLFHELLCGHPPFAGTTPQEVISQHLVAPVPRLPAHLMAYQSILDRLLNKQSQQRPHDGRAVLQEIDALAPGVGAD